MGFDAIIDSIVPACMLLLSTVATSPRYTPRWLIPSARLWLLLLSSVLAPTQTQSNALGVSGLEAVTRAHLNHATCAYELARAVDLPVVQEYPTFKCHFAQQKSPLDTYDVFLSLCCECFRLYSNPKNDSSF